MQLYESYTASESRYERSDFYRRCGNSGLMLPRLSFGLWHNFGNITPLGVQQQILRTAFDAGITHFDLANNYGPPYGEAETNFGILMDRDWRPYRDELIISTKAGYDMWPGPYGNFGSRKYLIASADQSLKRMHLDYVDIFYHHRPDPETPLEETMGALKTIVDSGRALYVGISNYPADRAKQAAEIMKAWGVPLLICQSRYNMFTRNIEEDLLETLKSEGMGCIVFQPLAGGLLTDKYIHGIPAHDHGREDHEGGETQRTGSKARGEPGADGLAVGAAGRESDLGADRRQPAGADPREHQSAAVRGLFRGGTAGDRHHSCVNRAGVSVWILSQ